MTLRWKIWMDRFKGRDAALPSLDLLASSASPRDTLENRLNWLVDLVQWIRRPGNHPEAQIEPPMQIQAGRLRRLLDVLDKNPEWKIKVAKTLRSIILETNALDLFSETGLPRRFGLFHELGERLASRFLPPLPDSAELGVLFDRLFPHRDDETWIENLDEASLQRFHALLEFEVSPEEKDWNALAADLEDAIIHLTAQLRVAGCSSAIRSRTKSQRIQELPFFKLSTAVQAALLARTQGDQANLAPELNHVRLLIESCYRAEEEVLAHLEENGVSTDVVYQLAYIEAALKRLEALLELAFKPDLSLTRVGAFVAMLVRENQARESVRDLLRQNFRLLTRKIVERNAKTGEHYIARTANEYWQMVRQAAGGGALMSVTTWFKTMILTLHFAALWEGVAASINYALGFVAIQLCGFTLATKQPATTAPALAARMHQVRDPKAMSALADEVVFLIRSQVAAILGNITLVMPTVVVLHFLVLFLTGAPILPMEKATATLHSVSILGPSFLFAGLTGVLLWASSLIGAWADNWIAWHRLGEALTSDRRLMRMLGPSRTARFARFLQHNVAGFGSNISLGVMLGLLPELAKFAGLPLDVRHVTLSSGFAAAAVATLGPGIMLTWPFWLAVMGILSIGVINVTVSFALAMFVAIRARGIQSPERRIIYQALLLRLRQQPLSFVFPTRSAATNSPASSATSNVEAEPQRLVPTKLETTADGDPNLG
jgi:site-specific recombinase